MKNKTNNTQPPQPPVSKLRRNLQWVGSAIIILLVANFCYQIWSRNHQNAHFLTKNAQCNIQEKTCLVKMKGNQSASLEVTPRPFKAGETIQATVMINGINPQHIYALIFPIGQESSKNKPTPLHLTDDGKFLGELIVPANKSKHKKWVIMLLIQTDKTNYAIPYRFQL